MLGDRQGEVLVRHVSVILQLIIKLIFASNNSQCSLYYNNQDMEQTANPNFKLSLSAIRNWSYRPATKAIKEMLNIDDHSQEDRRIEESFVEPFDPDEHPSDSQGSVKEEVEEEELTVTQILKKRRHIKWINSLNLQKIIQVDENRISRSENTQQGSEDHSIIDSLHSSLLTEHSLPPADKQPQRDSHDIQQTNPTDPLIRRNPHHQLSIQHLIPSQKSGMPNQLNLSSMNYQHQISSRNIFRASLQTNLEEQPQFSQVNCLKSAQKIGNEKYFTQKESHKPATCSKELVCQSNAHKFNKYEQCKLKYFEKEFKTKIKIVGVKIKDRCAEYLWSFGEQKHWFSVSAVLDKGIHFFLEQADIYKRYIGGSLGMSYSMYSMTKQQADRTEWCQFEKRKNEKEFLKQLNHIFKGIVMELLAKHENKSTPTIKQEPQEVVDLTAQQSTPKKKTKDSTKNNRPKNDKGKFVNNFFIIKEDFDFNKLNQLCSRFGSVNPRLQLSPT